MPVSAPHIPANHCIYAIGDIHGHKDKLQQLIGLIAEDAARHPATARTLIFLGDYIDRGPESKGVIDYLMHDLPANFAPVFLRGNHEDVLLRLLAGETHLLPSWLQFGGRATLASYGIDVFRPRILETPDILRAELARNLPVEHLQFFENTVFSYIRGDYFFTHAGARPGIDLAQQDSDDLMWIRDDFLNSTEDFGKIVVHGHSISFDPDIRPNRIGIDTGAYATGRLTCLKLSGTERQFFVT